MSESLIKAERENGILYCPGCRSTNTYISPLRIYDSALGENQNVAACKDCKLHFTYVDKLDRWNIFNEENKANP